MIIPVTGIATIVFFILAYIFARFDKTTIGFMGCLLSIIMIIISGGLFCGYSFVSFDNNNPKEKEELRIRLNNQIEAIYYAQQYALDDDPIQVIQMIKTYNTEITKNKALRNDKWFGTLFSEVYDEYEKIEYEEIFNNERPK